MPYSKYFIHGSTMESLADAVRNLTGKSSAFTPAQMISEVNNYEYEFSYIKPLQYAGDKIRGNFEDLKAEVIGYGAFRNCSYLNNVNIPECKLIDEYAFALCTRMPNMNFPNCEHIGSSAFYGCTYNFSAISIPKCTYIGSFAFRNCTKLVSLYLNSVTSVTKLDDINAFQYSPLSTGGSGTVYVPTSLLTAFKNANNWSDISNKIVGI